MEKEILERIKRYKVDCDEISAKYRKGVITFMELHNKDHELLAKCRDDIFDIAWQGQVWNH